MEHKNILVLGGSGATGQRVVQMAVERGYKVTALVRAKEGIEARDGLEIVQGDVLDAVALDKAMTGKQAVLSCLGINRKNAANPFSQLTSPVDFAAQSAGLIVSAMKKHAVGRLIAISAAGVGDSRDKVDAMTRFLFRVSKLSITLADSENMEGVYNSAGLDSLMVRPVRLVDGVPTGKAILTQRCGGSSKIARSDVAAWMVDALARPEPFAEGSETIAWG